MSESLPVKRCPDCGLEKPASDFGRNKRLADGLAQYRKEWFRRRSKASYRKRMAVKGRTVRERPDLPEGSKYCPSCEEIKALAEFGRNRAEKSGRAAYCKPCHNRVMAENKAKNHGSVRSYFLKRRYGLTEEEVAALSERHGDVCLICLHRRPLHVDHDHGTGEVRGLLCFSCNGGLGQFKDDPRVIRRAVDHLEGRLGGPYRPEPRARRTRGDMVSHRHYHLVRRYGIGAEDVQRLVDRQGGVCPLCRERSPEHVDHDHVTGAVRGILCADCNTGMGQLRDDPFVLRRAIEYLTGGLPELQRTADGFEVAVVRPRGSGPAVDPGWPLGRACTDDLALLDAMARGHDDAPWETDVVVAEPGWSPEEPAGASPGDVRSLDLAALPREPLGVPEWALTSSD